MPQEIDFGRLDHYMEFRGLLRDAGQDPVMHTSQDAFFDRVYWEPAIKSCNFIGVKTALGSAVVYDSRIHGSWHAIRNRVNEQYGELRALTEQTWIATYVDARHARLAGHSNALLHKTVYRMDAFKKLIDSGSWDLALPFKVRGIEISEDVLTGSSPIRVSAEEPGGRLLKLRQPFMRGADVENLQKGLSAAGIDVATDGIFGPGTERAVIAYQKRQGLVIDGVVAPATLAELQG